jgi:4-aminobutyrate aminotransferase-like enzyme
VPQPANQNRDLKTAIPGPKSQSLRQREDAHLAPGAQGYALMSGVVVDHAEGTSITDVDGNTFLDFIGGIAVGALGHSHPTWVEAIQKQAGRAAVGSMTSEARVDLFERFARHAPANGVHRLQMYSGGAEAVESALRLAKSYTGKYEFVSCWGGFHGKTMGALSLMGSTFKDKLGPMVPGSHQVPYADCYRCPLGLQYPTCGVACAEVLVVFVKLRAALIAGIAAARPQMQRRRSHALHEVGGVERRHADDDGDVQAGHRSRRRAGRGPESRLAGAVAAPR